MQGQMEVGMTYRDVLKDVFEQFESYSINSKKVRNINWKKKKKSNFSELDTKIFVILS